MIQANMTIITNMIARGWEDPMEGLPACLWAAFADSAHRFFNDKGEEGKHGPIFPKIPARFGFTMAGARSLSVPSALVGGCEANDTCLVLGRG